MLDHFYFKINALLFLIGFTSSISFAQTIDSTQIGKEYPYVLPILGKKAYEKGYKLQLPHGLSIGTIFNKQGIVLENFEMAFTKPGEDPDFGKLQPISDLIEFGPSNGRINTLNYRFDTWILPFLSVGGYYGNVWGEQVVTLTAPIELSSVTDIKGEYYGMNLVGLFPVGPVVISADYSWSWTTNVRLDDPVKVEVSGMRVLKRVVSKKRSDRFWAFWIGAQHQKLANRTSGKIGLGEALSIDDGFVEDMDSKWEAYKMTPDYENLPTGEKIKKEAAYQIVREGVINVSETTVHYKFDKRLEHPWNMLLGANWNINDRFQVRAEYGFLKSKQQLMVMGSYRFGI